MRSKGLIVTITALLTLLTVSATGSALAHEPNSGRVYVDIYYPFHHYRPGHWQSNRRSFHGHHGYHSHRGHRYKKRIKGYRQHWPKQERRESRSWER